MSDSRKSMREKFRLLQQSYVKRLPDRFREVEQLWNELIHDSWDQKKLGRIHHMVHNLAGTGKTFGFAPISDVSRDLDVVMNDLLENGTQATPDQREKISRRISELKILVNKAAPASLTRFIDPYLPSEQVRERKETIRKICLFNTGIPPSEELSLQLGRFGYFVDICSSVEELEKAAGRIAPPVVILNVPLPDEETFELLARIRQVSKGNCPVILLALEGDVRSRLGALRSGCAYYFLRPVDVLDLVDALDALTAAVKSEPFRVLLVDDDATLVSYYSLVLKHVGMETHVVTDPMKVMAPLNEFRPDLILLDIYMPGCSGLELAAVIRQQKAYVSVPVVFLSTETRVDIQLDAMLTGGDDYITKPVHPDHLIPMVISRAKRYRMIRSFMTRDGMTGLLNHTYTKEQLQIELERAVRQNTPLSCALIDLDEFKKINDTYGHPMGDRVLTSLSRMLKQRLRKSDIVGRYGGDEFSVILPSTSQLEATNILNEIRKDFSHVPHTCKSENVFATFSCGIASYPDFADPDELNNATDQALYRAKKKGRNRVETLRLTGRVPKT